MYFFFSEVFDITLIASLRSNCGGTARMVGGTVAEKLCQDHWAQRVMAEGSSSDWCLVRSDANGGLVAGPMLLTSSWRPWTAGEGAQPCSWQMATG